MSDETTWGIRGHGADLSEVPDERRCVGTTAQGTQCKRWARPDMPWCREHLKIEQKKHAATVVGDESGLFPGDAERDRDQRPRKPPAGAVVDGEVVPYQRLRGYRLDASGKLLTASEWLWAVDQKLVTWPPSRPARRSLLDHPCSGSASP